MATTVNQMELSRLLDVTAKTVRAWQAQGCPVEVKSTRRGVPSEYSVAAVVRWREDQARLAATGDIAAMDLEEARRRKLSAEAAVAEIELDRLRGTVVELTEIEKVIGPALSACRSRLLSVGASVAPKVELAPDTAAVRELIDDAIHEALDEISSLDVASEPEGGDGEGDARALAGPDAPAAESDAERMGRFESGSLGGEFGGARKVADEPG